MSVNADKVVRILPRLIGGGTPGLKFSGLVLTKNELAPAQRVLQFGSADAVGRYFGLESEEYKFAWRYFQGYIDSTSLPSFILFARYNERDTSGWLRGAPFTGSLSDLRAIGTGALWLDIDGRTHHLVGLDFTQATSFSEVAQIIQDALRGGATTGPKVAYSSQTEAFQIEGESTDEEVGGVRFAVMPENGTDVGALLGLTEQAGAILSPAAKVQTLSEVMSNVLNYSRDWVTFTTLWEPDVSGKIELARWCAGHDTRFCYVLWDTDVAARKDSAASAGRQIRDMELSGTSPNYGSPDLASFVMGCAASINFNETNGRTTLAFRRGEGLAVTCDNDGDYERLMANGYNCYADFASASANFRFYQNGSVTGEWKWLDTYLNAIALKDGLQLNLLDLFAATKSIPYSEEGYAMVRTACLDTISRFLAFGAIRPGVLLSQTQKVTLKSEIGRDVSRTLESEGWYMLVRDPGAHLRAQRGSPECKFYYMDGGSIQKIEMSATAIQ